MLFFVAEDRLNAMVVYGTRKERDVIQEIIEVLDAEDLPDSLTTPSPELIQIEKLVCRPDPKNIRIGLQ